MTDRLDPAFVRAQIEALRVAYPEIWESGDEQLLMDALEGETDMHVLLTMVVRRLRDAEAFAAGIAALIDDETERRRRYERREEAMRRLAYKIMDIAGVKKVELLQATLSIRAGTPHVIITDEKALPDDYVRIKREPNKIKLRDDLRNGYRVAGAELSNAEPVLNVRPR